MNLLPPAAILAGGLGTRIREVGGDTPKVLLPVEGRPFLGHLLDKLKQQHVGEVLLLLGFEADQVFHVALEEAPEGLSLRRSDETKPLGTGGALMQAIDHLPSEFFLLNGDTYLDVSLQELWEFHRDHEASLSLTLVSSESAGEKGSVTTKDDGRITKFDEKTTQGTGWINAGVYCFSKSVLAPFSQGAASLEREYIPAMIEAQENVFGIKVAGSFVDIGLPQDYLGVVKNLPQGEKP